MQTIILGMMAFNVQHTKRKISKAMLKVRSKFGIFPGAEFIEEMPQFTTSDWGESLRIWGWNSWAVWIVMGHEERIRLVLHYNSIVGANVSVVVKLKESMGLE